MNPRLKRILFLASGIVFWGLFLILNFLNHNFTGIFPHFSMTEAAGWYAIAFIGFILLNGIHQQLSFARIEKFDVNTLIWRMFIIGMSGITIILLLIVAQKLLDRYTTSDITTSNLNPVFFSISIYAYIIFFISMIFLFRRFVFYQKTRRKLTLWNIFLVLQGLVLVFTLDPRFFRAFPVFFIIFAIAFVIVCLLLATNVDWTAYLNFNQKLRTLGMLCLMAIIIIAYIFAFQRFLVDFGQVWISDTEQGYLISNQQYIFLISLLVFPIAYIGFSILVLIFNLPMASMFERRSSEVTSFNRLNQAILSNLDFSEILDTLLGASLWLTDAQVGWIELVEEGHYDAPQIEQTRGIKKEEIEDLKQGYQLTAVVLKDQKPFLIKDLKRHKAFKDRDTAYRSLLCIPIISNTAHGAIFILKELSNSFEEETVESVTGFASQAGIAIENARLVRDSIDFERYREQLKIAKEMQNELLPQTLPSSEKIEFVAISANAEEVGGDYYDIVEQPGLYKIAIGDVSGKGTTAAFYMAEIKGVFHALTLMDLSVRDFIFYANKAFSACLQKGFFMTLTYLHIKPEEQEIEMIRAGHCPGFLWQAAKKEILTLREGTLGLGLVRNDSFGNYIKSTDSFRFESGDVLVLYTDGIPEAKNPEREEFGYDRLKFVIADSHEGSAAEMAENIEKSLAEFTQSKAQDDYTILIIKFL